MASSRDRAGPEFSDHHLRQAAEFLKTYSFGPRSDERPQRKEPESGVGPPQRLPPARKSPQNGHTLGRPRSTTVSEEVRAPPTRHRSRSKSAVSKRAQNRLNDKAEHPPSYGTSSLLRKVRTENGNGYMNGDGLHLSMLTHMKKLIKEGLPAEQGIVNDGVYCYAIVFVQSLLGTDAFARLSLSKNINWHSLPLTAKRLIQVLRLLWINDRSASNAVKMLVYDVAQADSSIDIMQQQDVFEFMTLLFGKILPNLARGDVTLRCSEASIFHEICTGVLQYTSQCTGCDYKRTNSEFFSALSLPVLPETGNEIDICAVVQNQIYRYGLCTKAQPSVTEVLRIIASDCRVSQSNSVVMAFNWDRLKVFKPQLLLTTNMRTPMFFIAQMPFNSSSSSDIDVVVFLRSNSVTAPYVSTINIKSPTAIKWRRIVSAVFSSDERSSLPKVGELFIEVANEEGLFERFAEPGLQDFHPLHTRHLFYLQNLLRSFIVLRIDLRRSRRSFLPVRRSLYEHESYKANQGPVLDRLIAGYFQEERIPFRCRNCCGSSLRRTARIVQRPQVLFLHLNRFARNGSATIKVNSKLRIPRDILDMSPYVHSSQGHTAEDGGQRYHLCAVICHIGDSVSSGHYQCYRRNPVTGKWCLFSDSQVFSFEFPKILSSSSAYFLVYEKTCASIRPGRDHWFRQMNAEELMDTAFPH